jgi:hypothetical protein
VTPALALLPAVLDSRDARVMLLAVALQESGLKYRRQIHGPALGLWQFEQGDGVHGVLQHATARLMALGVCEARGVVPIDHEVYAALERDDLIACAFARLLLFTDPKSSPKAGEMAAAWALYLRTWRPGRPHLSRWETNYPRAVEAVA